MTFEAPVKIVMTPGTGDHVLGIFILLTEEMQNVNIFYTSCHHEAKFNIKFQDKQLQNTSCLLSLT